MILAVIGTVTVLTAITILWLWSMKFEPSQISQLAYQTGEEKNRMGKIIIKDGAPLNSPVEGQIPKLES